SLILFFYDPRPTQTYTLSLHDALPIFTAAAADLDAEMTSILDGCAKAHPVALRRTKRLLDEVGELGLDTGLRLAGDVSAQFFARSEEHTSELQSRENLVCRLLLEKKK